LFYAASRGAVTASGETPLGIRAQRKRATREELLQAARELFAQRGYDKVTVAEIAAGAGVSVKTLFQHFRSKEDLLLAELDQTHERLLNALRERTCESPVDALVSWMSSEIENSPPDGMERWEQAVGNTPAVAALRRRLYEQWEIAIARVLADEANEARPTPRTRLLAAELVAIVRVTSSDEVRDFVLHHPSHDRRAAYKQWLEQASGLVSRGLSG
jgi:AcrR family transcriptional regulator